MGSREDAAINQIAMSIARIDRRLDVIEDRLGVLEHAVQQIEHRHESRLERLEQFRNRVMNEGGIK